MGLVPGLVVLGPACGQGEANAEEAETDDPWCRTPSTRPVLAWRARSARSSSSGSSRFDVPQLNDGFLESQAGGSVQPAKSTSASYIGWAVDLWRPH